MTVLVTTAGAALIVLVVQDIFTVLFRPGVESRLSGGLARAVWALLRRAGARRGGLFTLAGPFALASVISSWAAVLVLGWALIYLPHYPRDFAVAAGAHSPLIGAIHVSLATITTLGSSSAVPRAGWLQIVSPIEALIGFGLLTAAVAYLLQLYPVLSRRRSLAYEIHLLVDAERRLGRVVSRTAPEPSSEMYGELTSRLIAVERDLVKFPIAYYFAETDPRFALSAAMPELIVLAHRGAGEDNPISVRLRASMLQEAIDDFAQTVAERFLSRRHHSTIETLRAFARDHRHGAHWVRPDGGRQPSADLPVTPRRKDRATVAGH